MREIKFRAFENEKMHYFDLSDTIAPNMEMKVMQYTGLKDKNGKEIYEGDIVKCPVTINKHIWGEFQNRVVKWKEDSFTWVFDSEYSWGRFEDNLTGEGDYIRHTEQGLEVVIEIVGNIHENPELLEQ